MKIEDTQCYGNVCVKV